VRITLIQGHPDPAGGHFGHALAEAYARAATDAAHEVRTIEVARLEFPLLRSAADWKNGAPAPSIRDAQASIAWAEHLVIFFPLWLGDMPALLKGFLEQALRPGFALGAAAPGRMPKKLLKGRSARIVVTMGMPAFFYRLYYRAHSVNSLKRNILESCGFSPVRASLVGTVEGSSRNAHELWLAKMETFGRAGT
jgi:putative NADPH-quinone reductase